MLLWNARCQQESFEGEVSGPQKSRSRPPSFDACAGTTSIALQSARVRPFIKEHRQTASRGQLRSLFKTPPADGELKHCLRRSEGAACLRLSGRMLLLGVAGNTTSMSGVFFTTAVVIAVYEPLMDLPSANVHQGSRSRGANKC